MILLLVASTRPTACAVLIQVHLEAATRAAANKAMTAIPTSPTDAKISMSARTTDALVMVYAPTRMERLTVVALQEPMATTPYPVDVFLLSGRSQIRATSLVETWTCRTRSAWGRPTATGQAST